MTTNPGFDDRGAPDPSPFAGDDDVTPDDPTPLEVDYRRDHPEFDPRRLQAVGLVPKDGPATDVDPSGRPTIDGRLALLDRIETYIAATPRGQSPELDHVRNLIESGS